MAEVRRADLAGRIRRITESRALVQGDDRFTSTALSVYGRDEEGEKRLYLLVYNEMKAFQSALNIAPERQMTADQMSRGANMLLNEFSRDLTPEDVPIFFERALMGRYGRVEYSLNIQKVAEMMHQYLDQKDEERERFAEKDKREAGMPLASVFAALAADPRFSQLVQAVQEIAGTEKQQAEERRRGRALELREEARAKAKELFPSFTKADFTRLWNLSCSRRDLDMIECILRFQKLDPAEAQSFIDKWHEARAKKADTPQPEDQ